MTYTIQETAARLGVSASALRYYEKENLLPDIKRDKNGRRYYDEDDIGWLEVILCLKATNMPIKDIRKFVQLNFMGDCTLQERLEMVLAHRQNVQKQIDELTEYMKHINHKVEYFTKACKLGTEKELKYSNNFL